MLIPLGTDRPLRRPTFVVPILIGINIAIHLGKAILERLNPDRVVELVHQLGVSGAGFKPWTPLTYAFIHGDWMHLLGNMIILWVFGQNVEDRFRRGWFLAFYLVGGAAAGGLHACFEDNPAIGASGAIAAVTGAYLVLFPRTSVRCFIFFFLIFGIYMIPAWAFLLVAIARDFVFVGSDGDNVARLAHIGGYSFGIAVSLILLATRVLSREPYDLFTIGRQAYRRRQLREAAHAAERADAKAGIRRAPGSPALDEETTKRRAEIAAAFAASDIGSAAGIYKQLVDRHADQPTSCTLSRRHQLDLANYYFSTSDYPSAAYAYQRFLETYERDNEVPRVRLMLGLISARYLNDPVHARQVLTGLPQLLRDPDQAALAQSLLEELG